MFKSISASLTLLATSCLLCCGIYPIILFTLGRALFPIAATGSLVDERGEDANTDAKGSRLIAQPFTAEGYFHPRPSAVLYNATASGGSNWGANNPRLRNRVCQQLGPLIVYKKGSPSAGAGSVARTPQQDIDAWFAAVPDRAARWAAESSIAPADWARTDLEGDGYGLRGAYVLQWANDHPDVLDAWKQANPNATADPKPEELVVPFFASFAKVHPAKWPGVVETDQAGNGVARRIEPVSSDVAIHANFFDMWLSDPANSGKAADLEPVAVDMATASGSGLDPHITLRNALSVYQLDQVAARRVSPGGDVAKTRADVEALVRSRSFTPLAGLVGEPLVNVLELNIELDRRFPLAYAGR